MLKRIRIWLTLLYFAVAVILIATVGAGSYFSLLFYFQNTTDLALRVKMAAYFRKMDLPVPEELIAAEKQWLASSGGGNTVIPLDDEEEEARLLVDAYGEELAAVFVFPLNQRGELLYNPNPYQVPFEPDREAAAAAWQTGHDQRTLTLPDQTHVRLLSYRVEQPIEDLVLQIGRSMADQYRVLNRYLMGFLFFGGSLALLMGAGSWFLAERSLRPAQRAWKNQQDFVANASHELRAPITLIHSSAEVALRTGVDGETRSLLADIVRDASYMSRLVENLLLLTRLDHHQINPARDVVELSSFLNGICAQTKQLVKEKAISVGVQAAMASVVADQNLLRQVLLTLAENAIANTPDGGQISFSASQAGDWVEIRVQDTGVGIAPQHLPHIFERFYRVNHQTGDDQRGSGLGLSIAKDMIELQGGTIKVISEPGKGTNVVITLPSAHYKS